MLNVKGIDGVWRVVATDGSSAPIPMHAVSTADAFRAIDDARRLHLARVTATPGERASLRMQSWAAEHDRMIAEDCIGYDAQTGRIAR